MAMQAARENPGNYGPQLSGTRMVFQLVEQEEGEDYYIVTLSFRPEGDFTGSPGQEQFFIEKEGPVADRQVLSLPTGGRRRRFPVIPVAIGAGVLAVVVVAGVVFAAGGLGGGGDGEGPVEALVPTSTPAAIAAPVPPVVAAPTATPSPTPVPPATTVPLAVVATPPAAAVAVPTPAPPVLATAPSLPTATTVPAAAPLAVPTVTAAQPLPAFTPTTVAPAAAAPAPTPTPTPTPTPGPTSQGRIAFIYGSEIYVMNADGSVQTSLTYNLAGESAPAWSPDGSKIAFSASVGGNPE